MILTQSKADELPRFFYYRVLECHVSWTQHRIKINRCFFGNYHTHLFKFAKSKHLKRQQLDYIVAIFVLKMPTKSL